MSTATGSTATGSTATGSTATGSTGTTYELVLRGRASARLLRPLLDEFSVDHARPGVTRLVGRITDACHLHGVLAHLTSVGVELVSLGPDTGTPRSLPTTTAHPDAPHDDPGASA